MPEYISAAGLRQRIVDGDAKCEADQKEITRGERQRANELRLAVRQKWAADRKATESHLGFVEIEEQKK